MYLQNSYIETLITPSAMEFGEGPLGRQFGLAEVMRVRPSYEIVR